MIVVESKFDNSKIPDMGSGGFRCRAFRISILRCSLNSWHLIVILPK